MKKYTFDVSISFRISEEQNKRFDNLIRKSGKSKTEILRKLFLLNLDMIENGNLLKLIDELEEISNNFIEQSKVFLKKKNKILEKIHREYGNKF